MELLIMIAMEVCSFLFVVACYRHLARIRRLGRVIIHPAIMQEIGDLEVINQTVKVIDLDTNQYRMWVIGAIITMISVGYYISTTMAGVPLDPIGFMIVGCVFCYQMYIYAHEHEDNPEWVLRVSDVISEAIGDIDKRARSEPDTP